MERSGNPAAAGATPLWDEGFKLHYAGIVSHRAVEAPLRQRIP
jgi:hypothetical protein